MKYFECRGYRLPLGKKTYIMGILNVTPDSFSDGGKYSGVEAAVEKASEMVENGADIIDIGGESTRPGYIPVDAEEEISRVVPVIEILAKRLRVPISVDTNKGVVAEKALQAGAHIVNDIWGLQKDPLIAEAAAAYNAGVVMMHNKDDKVYDDLMKDVKSFLIKSIEIATKAGINRERMIIDPGVGFGKTFEHNLEIMRRLYELKDLELPILLGTSRKSLIGNILNLPVTERIEGTAATVALGIAGGADIIRIHDVAEMYRVAKVTDAIVRGFSK